LEQVLYVENVIKTYGDRTVLDDISFGICRGDIVGLIGKNGAGKTTLLKLIAGGDSFDRGDIEVCGKSVKCDGPEYYANVGVTLDDLAFYPFFNAVTNLQLFSSDKDDRKIHQLLKTVGLESAQTQRLAEFSLGMRQRLNIARAFLNDPKLLLMDEPINGLDPKAVDGFKKICQKYISDNDSAMIIASHLLKELLYFCTKYIFLNNGMIECVIDTQNKQIEKLNAFILINDENLGAEYKDDNHIIVTSIGKLYFECDRERGERLKNVHFLPQGLNVLEDIYLSMTNTRGGDVDERLTF